MLTARRTGFWRSGYEITVDGRTVIHWERSFWRSGGAYLVGGRRHEVRTNAWGSRYELLDPQGSTVATADRVGRKRWTVTSAGVTYQFQRASMWRADQVLVGGGGQAGLIRRTSNWTGAATADLPGLPEELQVFVFVVVLNMWDRAAAASAAGGGG
jgi:hypothetical protein